MLFTATVLQKHFVVNNKVTECFTHSWGYSKTVNDSPHGKQRAYVFPSTFNHQCSRVKGLGEAKFIVFLRASH